MATTTNPIVDLPAMMRSAEPTGSQSALALIPEVVISGPEFDPFQYIEASTVEQIRQFVSDNVRAVHFDHEFLMRLIQDFGAGDIPQMDAMLKSLQMQKHGEMAKTLQNTTGRMRQVTRRIPVIDPKWISRVEAGKVMFRDIAANVRYLSDEINKAINMWSSFYAEFERADNELRNHQEQMRENRERNDSIAKQEFVRAMRLIQLCATLTFIRQEIGKRLTEINSALAATGPNETLTEEQRRLENVAPILINTLGSLIPLIPTTSNNGRMFIGQRNDNALQEFRLFLFRTLGMAQWKANTLIQLNAASSRAAGLALSIAQKAMNEEGRKASEAYLEEMKRVASELQEFMIEMETFQQQVAAIEEASVILTEGLKAADQKARQVSQTIEAGKGRVEKAHQNWSNELRQIMTGTAA
jgi:hypothetical protein